MMGSVLETFWILFKSDATDIEKGTQQAKASTDKLNTSLSTSNMLANKVSDSLANMARQFGSAILAVAGIGSIVAGIKLAADYSANLDRLSKKLNVNIQDLDAWSSAVKASGGSAEEFQGTLSRMVEAFAGKGPIASSPEFFRELGIRMTDTRGRARNFLTVLPEIATAFEKISKPQSFAIGKKLGLDEGTIQLLQRGRREVDAMITRQKELGLVTKIDGEIAKKYNDQWIDTEHAFRSLFVQIGSAVLPAITMLAKVFERVAVFFRKHSDLIVGGLIAISIALVPIAAGILTAFAPLFGITAVLLSIGAAFALVYDDVRAFYKGNNSVLGEMIKRWPVVAEILKFVGEEVKGVIGIFTALGDTVFAVWSGITAVIMGAINAIVGAFNKIETIWNKVKSFVGLNGDNGINIALGQNALQNAQRFAFASPNLSTLTNSTNAYNRTTSLQTGAVTINTQATDANGIAGAFNSNLQKQLQQAVGNFDDGRAI